MRGTTPNATSSGSLSCCVCECAWVCLCVCDVWMFCVIKPKDTRTISRYRLPSILNCLLGFAPFRNLREGEREGDRERERAFWSRRVTQAARSALKLTLYVTTCRATTTAAAAASRFAYLWRSQVTIRIRIRNRFLLRFRLPLKPADDWHSGWSLPGSVCSESAH